MFLNLKGRLVSLDSPIVMGILNTTEDSFYDGGYYTCDKAVLERAASMLDEGADLIDVGAMSTRPGASDVDEETEKQDISHTVSLLIKHFPNCLISVDTWRASVAQAAINSGACFINDISGGTFDENMLSVVANARVPYCLMHTPAKPDTMQECTQYDDIISDILRFFGTQIAKLKALGANDIVLDPGFGFGKTTEQNFFLLQNLKAFTCLNLPILAGLSRKSMIYKTLNTNPAEALNGTTVLHTIALQNGANILRVHDVREAKEAITLLQQF